MKKNKNSIRKNEPDSSLFQIVAQLLEEDLANPRIEAAARTTLTALREAGYFIDDSDLFDPDCLSCLLLSLMSALDVAQAHRPKQITHLDLN